MVSAVTFEHSLHILIQTQKHSKCKPYTQSDSKINELH